MPYLYILLGGTGRYYIGSTLNLEKRLKDHKSGNTHTTQRMGKLEMKFNQWYDSLEDARRVERKLKGLKRKDYIERIISDGKITMKP